MKTVKGILHGWKIQSWKHGKFFPKKYGDLAEGEVSVSVTKSES